MGAPILVNSKKSKKIIMTYAFHRIKSAIGVLKNNAKNASNNKKMIYVIPHFNDC